MRGRDGGPGFPKGLFLSLPLFSCKNCQSLTSAAGLLIGSAATRRSLIGHWAQCASRASLLPSLLHTGGNAAMQRDDCLFLAVAAGEPSPLLLTALGPDVRCCCRRLLWDVQAEALCTQHTSDSLPPQGSGCCTASILHKPAHLALSLCRLSLSLSLFSLVRRQSINMRAHTYGNRQIYCRRSHMLLPLCVCVFLMPMVCRRGHNTQNKEKSEKCHRPLDCLVGRPRTSSPPPPDELWSRTHLHIQPTH